MNNNKLIYFLSCNMDIEECRKLSNNSDITCSINHVSGAEPMFIILKHISPDEIISLSDKYNFRIKYNYLVKIHSDSIQDLDKFLDIASEKKMQTIPKLVLSTVQTEKNGKFKAHDEKNRENIKKDLEYAIARMIS